MSPDMLLMITYACIVGALIGSFSGLIPGIHVNTLAAIILAFHEVLENILMCIVPKDLSTMMMACCVMSAAVVHSATDFVPSVFFGVPDPDNVMNIMPGHSMLLEGHGMMAIRCAAIGSLVGSFTSIALAIPMFHLLSSGLGDYLDSLTIGILLAILSMMILKERKGRRILALILIIISGAIGCVMMTVEIPFTNAFGMEPESMFPMLSGFFGIPALLFSSPSGNIPEQTDDEKYPIGPIPGLKGVLTGSIIGWFPGVTSSCGASVAGSIFGNEDRRGYVAMVSSIGTSATMFTLVALAVSGKERSGTMTVINEILGGNGIAPGNDLFLAMMITMALASVMAYAIMVSAGTVMCKMVEIIDIDLLNKVVLTSMLILTILFTGYWGMILLLLCALIGLIPVILDTNRIHLTGCLMIPVLLFKLGFM